MTKKSRDPANAVFHGQTLESLGPSYLRRLAEELRGILHHPRVHLRANTVLAVTSELENAAERMEGKFPRNKMTLKRQCLLQNIMDHSSPSSPVLLSASERRLAERLVSDGWVDKTDDGLYFVKGK